MAIVFVTIPLLLTTATLTKHSLFEHRRPALLDNPTHMLMGPMFIVAKFFVALGFRPDLAAILSEVACLTEQWLR